MSGAANARKNFEGVIASLQRARKSKIFCLVHTDEPQHICGPEFRTCLRRRDEFSRSGTLEILVHSPGGHANVAYRLAQYFRRHCKHLNLLVPIAAKSAATLLCLNADAVLMGEFAELGPLDAQLRDDLEKGKDYFSPIDEFKSVEFLREYAAEILDYFSFLLHERGMSVKQALHEAIPGVVGIMNPLYAHVDPSRLGSYRRVLAEGEEYATRLLQPRFGEHAKHIAERLVWDYPSHDFVIDREEAKTIGLPIQNLPVAQEKALIKSLLGLSEYGLPYLGFVPKQAIQKAAKPKAKPKAPATVPTTVPGPARLVARGS